MDDHFLDFLHLVHLFEAVDADAHSLVVGELGYLDEVLGTLAADRRAALPTVLHTFPEAEFNLADEARGDFSSGPKRALGDLEVFDPALEGSLAHVSLSDGHSDDTDPALLAHVETGDFRELALRALERQSGTSSAAATTIGDSTFADCSGHTDY